MHVSVVLSQYSLDKVKPQTAHLISYSFLAPVSMDRVTLNCNIEHEKNQIKNEDAVSNEPVWERDGG